MTSNLVKMWWRPCAVILVALLAVSCASAPDKNNGLVGLVSHCVRSNDSGSSHGNPGGDMDTGGGSVSNAFNEAAWLSASQQLVPYRVSPGDMLEVSFFARPFDPQDGDYRIECLDELKIQVIGQGLYSTDVTVRPDGKISYYQIGDITARGRTVQELQDAITERFREIIPSSEITVFLSRGNVMVNEFLSSLRGNGNIGTVRALRVRNDGIAVLPLLGEVEVAGSGLPDLVTDIKQRYHDVFLGGVAVTVDVKSSSINSFAVLGEVDSPGLFPVNRPVQPVFAIAMAGGASYLADTSRCVLARKMPNGEYRRYRVNLDVRQADGMANVKMGPEDILIVPPSGITNLDRMVDQYIRRLIPIRAGVSATYLIN